MRDITCHKCGREHEAVSVLPVRCRCGAVCWGCEKPEAVKRRRIARPPLTKPRPPCTHRGEQIGTAECDCQTKPSVYRCDHFGGPCVSAKPNSGPILVVIGDAKPKATHVRSCRGCPERAE